MGSADRGVWKADLSGLELLQDDVARIFSLTVAPGVHCVLEDSICFVTVRWILEQLVFSNMW